MAIGAVSGWLAVHEKGRGPGIRALQHPDIQKTFALRNQKIAFMPMRLSRMVLHLPDPQLHCLGSNGLGAKDIVAAKSKSLKADN